MGSPATWSLTPAFKTAPSQGRARGRGHFATQRLACAEAVARTRSAPRRHLIATSRRVAATNAQRTTTATARNSCATCRPGVASSALPTGIAKKRKSAVAWLSASAEFLAARLARAHQTIRSVIWRSDSASNAPRTRIVILTRAAAARIVSIRRIELEARGNRDSFDGWTLVAGTLFELHRFERPFSLPRAFLQTGCQAFLDSCVCSRVERSPAAFRLHLSAGASVVGRHE
jgi:hypothetical protein